MPAKKSRPYFSSVRYPPKRYDCGPPEATEWGLVVVSAGKHRGHVGEYDDDEGTKAIVYLHGDEFDGLGEACVQIARSLLRTMSPEEQAEYLDISKQSDMGGIVRRVDEQMAKEGDGSNAD